MDTIDAVSVDAERNDNLKKAKIENGFYNIIDGEKVSPSKRLSVVDPEKIALFGSIALVPVNCKPGRYGIASTLFEILSFRPVRVRTQVLVWSLARKASYTFQFSAPTPNTVCKKDYDATTTDDRREL